LKAPNISSLIHKGLDGSKLPWASARGEIVIAIDPAPGASLTERELRVPFRWEPR
jgi:hypothetical protein